ncbi:ricin-type beta-trefoil lectin domain protein [Actinoplanes sp. TRM 88003]|uniref:Ricin-type beta-trefoil lectin domain protein n=1 Tax=Paractinoplanes aksuensis TaxID=2939490 RepID=A0ABT1DVP4_9ACTN|nr:ricin-type beta-trefoil lectin domain protein [Actinoplanes aksuensis]MCO8273716.1 ricin-type beta-trefoil lectin domain protein [Actinoplanes aksuensis]
MTPALIRRTVHAVTAALVAAGLTAAGVAAAQPAQAAVACGVLFDDFSYSSASDPALGQRGWHIRTNAGGPGVPGASWSAGNISFPTVDGQTVARLQASTNGTAGGTSHAEMSLSDRRFFEGTYFARIKFADTPASGTDGDIVNQTFYTISPLRYAFDPIYSELDFSEYLPNGGWGASGPTNFQTTWYTYQADPWVQDRQYSSQSRSIAGWRDVMATVANGEVRYYIDGQLVGTHGGKFYPRQNMSIDFNQWFIDLTGHVGGGTSVWHENVDYVFHAKKQVLSPAEATARVNAFRSAGTRHTDNVTADNTCTPGSTDNPPASTTRIVSNWNNKCIDVPNWNFADRQRVHVWDCTDGTNQKWQFVNGTLRTENNKCLDVADAATHDGAAVQIYTCNGTAAQQFVLSAAGDLVNPQANKCVDIAEWKPDNGAVLHLWTCVGGANQKWRRG